MALRDFPTAIEALHRSVLLLPHSKTMERLGTCYERLNSPNEAILYFAAAAGLGNRNFRGRYLLAKSLAAVGLLEDAIQKLEEAIALNPNYRAARELLERLKPQTTRQHP